jgi:hypothetical protein
MIWYVISTIDSYFVHKALRFFSTTISRTRSFPCFFYIFLLALYLQPLRQRRLSNDIFGHAGAATDAVAPGHAGHHPDEEGQGEQQAPQGSSLRRLDRKNRYKVDVRFVQIKPNSTVPTIPTRSYRDSLRQVNRDYRGSGFTFRFVEAVAVVDPEHFGCSFYDETDFAVGQVYRQGNATMLNVLLCDTPEGVGGFSYQPFYLPSGGDFEKAVDAVFLREKQLNAVGFLTHEIGHWLGKKKENKQTGKNGSAQLNSTSNFSHLLLFTACFFYF